MRLHVGDPYSSEYLGRNVSMRPRSGSEQRQNPFQTLYLTEALDDPELFAKLFSPLIIPGEAEQLFRAGNVVLLGSNGAGKTMLLRLFSPHVCATVLAQEKPWPVPRDLFRFFSVGINLLHSGFGSLGQRRLAPDMDEHLLRWQLLFGDFLNYYLTNELLNALEKISSGQTTSLSEFLNISASPKQLDAYATWLSQRECWFGALAECRTLARLKDRAQARIATHQAFMNWNINEVPREIDCTKTRIGVPLAEAARGLQDLNILAKDVPFTITIDQYETLAQIDYESTPDARSSVGRALCRVVNSLLAARDPKVSYKIGARPFSWHFERRSFGTDARLELGRNYQIVDLDEILRRRENIKTWTFNGFAADVAARRIASTFRGQAEEYTTWLQHRLQELTPNEELARYYGKDPNKMVPGDDSWPSEWNALLREIYHRDRYEACLAAAWTHQIVGRGDKLPPITAARQKRPWDKQWWRKERREAIMTQAASACRQRRIYGGWSTVVTLSGANILVFLGLCREIWDVWDRSRVGREATRSISAEVQSHAIRIVSEAWLEKQTEFPGGATRKDFVIRLGIALRRALLDDKALSNPGHNGFSLLLEDYEGPDAAAVKAFLANACDFGALLASAHTTKERDRRPRRKWYIFPILCPQFEIPAIRTKEPFYTSVETVRGWMEPGSRIELRLRASRRDRRQGPRHQGSLFSDEEEVPGQDASMGAD